MSQRTKTIIISIVICIVLAGVGVGLYCAWPAIVGTITGNAYYTYEDVQNAYDDGYTDGIRNESELTAQIDYYKGEVDKYVISLGEAQSKVEELQKNLQDAINSGNADKETIAGLQEDLAEAQADITAKQEQIEELQDDIKYYEELLEAYEDSDKLRVTFTMVDNGKERNYDVQVVEPNGYISEVITPDRADFEGWSLTKGGELIDDLTTIQVTENMTIYGMCTNTVTFMVNGEEYATQEVSYNESLTTSKISEPGYIFYGWDFNNEPITKDTVINAIVKECKFEPTTFNNSENVYGSNIWTDSKNIYYSSTELEYVLDKETNTWDEKTWNINGIYAEYIWNAEEKTFFNDANKSYKLNIELGEWEEVEWHYLVGGTPIPYNFYGNAVRKINGNYYYLSNKSVFLLDTQNLTLKKVSSEDISSTFPGGSFASSYWTDGVNLYHSNGTSNQYIYNFDLRIWEETNWNILVNGQYVWNCGQNTYYSNGNEQYILDVDTGNWIENEWMGIIGLEKDKVWTDGTNIYYSNGSEQYVLV